MGFDDNDHVIRGLMRFIKMTNRESRIEDVLRNGGAPNYKWWWLETQRRFKFFLISNLSIEMSYYKGGHYKLAKVCNQVFNLIYIHPHMLSQDNQFIIVFTLAVLPCAAAPHLKRGNAAVRHWCSWAAALPWLNWLLGVGGIYTFPIPLQWLFFDLWPFRPMPIALCSFSLFSIGDLELSSILLWFPRQSLREKVSKLD